MPAPAIGNPVTFRDPEEAEMAGMVARVWPDGTANLCVQNAAGEWFSRTKVAQHTGTGPLPTGQFSLA